MEFTQEHKDTIKDNIMHINSVMKNKPRNYLNKQLQDAVCNYFLENYAAPFLKEEYNMDSGRELRKLIERQLPKEGKKYINLLNAFKTEIKRVNKGDEYRQMLATIVGETERFAFESVEWCTIQRKKILALLLIVHWDEENILNFYDMWNSLYPNDQLVKQKLSKQEKEKKKKLAKSQNVASKIKPTVKELPTATVTPVPAPSIQSLPPPAFKPAAAINSKRKINNRIFEEIDDDEEDQGVFFNFDNYQQSSIEPIPTKQRCFEEPLCYDSNEQWYKIPTKIEHEYYPLSSHPVASNPSFCEENESSQQCAYSSADQDEIFESNYSDSCYYTSTQFFEESRQFSQYRQCIAVPIPTTYYSLN